MYTAIRSLRANSCDNKLCHVENRLAGFFVRYAAYLRLLSDNQADRDDYDRVVLPCRNCRFSARPQTDDCERFASDYNDKCHQQPTSLILNCDCCVFFSTNRVYNFSAQAARFAVRQIASHGWRHVEAACDAAATAPNARAFSRQESGGGDTFDYSNERRVGNFALAIAHRDRRLRVRARAHTHAPTRGGDGKKEAAGRYGFAGARRRQV